jgi:hypothetical protein
MCTFVGKAPKMVQHIDFREPDETPRLLFTEAEEDCEEKRPVLRCDKCTFDNDLGKVNSSWKCSMCSSPLFAESQVEGQEWLAPIQEEGGASYAAGAAAEDDDGDGEWDTVEAEEGRGDSEDNSSDNNDDGSHSWEVVPSPTSWAAVAGNSSFGATTATTTTTAAVVVVVGGAAVSGRPLKKEMDGGGGHRQRSERKAGEDEEDECGFDADRKYSIFAADADYSKRTRRTRQSAACRQKRLDQQAKIRGE